MRRVLQPQPEGDGCPRADSIRLSEQFGADKFGRRIQLRSRFAGRRQRQNCAQAKSKN